MVDKNYVTWNTIISVLDQIEYFEEAIKSFCKMRRAGIVPSNFTLISTLNSCASLGWVMLGQQVHGEAFKLGLDSNISVSNALLALYADTGCVAECLKFFSLMPEDDQVSWNTVIGSLSVSESSISEAVKYYLNMIDWITFATVLSACASVATLECGMEVHASALRACLESDVVVGSALVDMPLKFGRIEYALRFFDMMPIRYVYFWISMISGYARNGHGDKALRLFSRMVQSGQRDWITSPYPLFLVLVLPLQL
ncbi:hypothetical protein LWI28_029281 [Acer negundo]|uniref:Pentatricopeptide repeat-containing protein n=1 Tax=Acer negundo TaxID=4023 RepID=A0AAD5NSL9_ACENE|nr:hypothetical protein LWI28_029281 [Acer negundo]